MSLQFIKHFLQSPRQLKPHTYVPHFIACLLSCCFATTALSFVLMAHLMCNGVVSNSCSLTTLASLHRTNSSTKLLIVSSLHSTPLSSITCMPFRPQIRAQFNALCCVPHYFHLRHHLYVYLRCACVSSFLSLILPSATFILMANKNCKSIYCGSYLLCIAWHVLYATVKMHVNV